MNNFYLGIHLNDVHFKNLYNALEITKKLGVNVLQVYLGNKRLTTLREKMRFTNDEIKIFWM